MEYVEGLEEIRKNLAAAEKRILDKVVLAADRTALMMVTYIKVTYQRPITGKGFTDRTGDLRRSITRKLRFETGLLIIYIYASMKYAPYVEHIAGGKYAFLLPGAMDKRREIIPNMVKEIRAQGQNL